MNKIETGIVIGAYSGAPYIHLQLEQHCRLHPETAMLVHDDSSPARRELAALCDNYGARFMTTPRRLGQQGGDMSAFRAGLHWAAASGFRVLIKQSMRWVPRQNIATGLAAALDGRHIIAGRREPVNATCRPSNPCMHTDLYAIPVAAWDRPALHEVLNRHIAEGGPLAECVMADWLAIAAQGTAMAPTIAEVPDILDAGRWTKHPAYLWHNWARPADYAELALGLGLPYTVKDFEGYPD